MVIDMSIIFQKNSDVRTENFSKELYTTMSKDSSKILLDYLKMQGSTNSSGIMAQIKGFSGNTVQLLLGNNATINANIEGEYNFNIGQRLIFQIQGDMSNKIMLSPLFSNHAMEENVYKALDMANIPIKDDAIMLVKSMMDSKQPVDAKNLQNMYREMVSNPEANVSTLVALKNLNLPIDKANISQFENYKQNEHYISNNLEKILDEIPNHLKNLVDVNATNNSNGNVVDNALQVNETILTGKEVAFKEVMNLVKCVADYDANSAKLDTLSNNIIDGKLTPQKLDELIISAREAQSKGGEAADTINNRILNNLIDTFDRLGYREDLSAAISESSEFSKLLKEVALKQLLLDPKGVSSESIEDLYSKLDKQTNKLINVINEFSNQNSPIGKEVVSLRQNIDFMNQVNQFANYVQIPLKMSNMNANAQLYVYANRDKLKKNDSELSAALQLDMDNLGRVNVFVKMKDKNVNTNFTLANEEALDLISDNIDVLSKRLEKLGYNVQTKLELDDKASDIIDEVLKIDMDAQDNIGIHYSFDMKA